MLNGPGKVLQQARKKKRYTIDKIHTATKIKKEYIEGLENDDVSIFPAELYYKNFLKSYALYLDLNPIEIISIYEQAKIEQQEELLKQTNNNKENKFAKFYKNNKKFFLFTGIIVVCILIFINIFFKTNIKEQQVDIADTNNIVVSTITTATPVSAIATQQTQEEQVDKQIINTKQKLYIKALANTWIKIISDNKKIFEGTLTKSFESKADKEFVVRIGNIDTVQVYFNDVLVNIKSDSNKSKVKTITLKRSEN